MRRMPFILVFLNSLCSFASDNVIQFLKPGEEQHEISTGFSYVTSSFQGTSSGRFNLNSKVNGFIVPFAYYYGLNARNAVGFEIDYGSIAVEKDEIGISVGSDPVIAVKDNQSGLSDLAIRYKGDLEGHGFRIYTEVGYIFPLEQAKSEPNGSYSGTFENKSNRYSEQSKLNLQTGISMPVSNFIFGALLGYNLTQKGNRKISSYTSSHEYDVVGGSDLKIQTFVELMNEFHLNGEIDYVRAYSKTYETSFSGLNSKFIATASGVETLGISISSRIALKSNFEVIPRFTYSTLLNKTRDQTDFDWFNATTIDIKKSDTYNLNMNFRLIF